MAYWSITALTGLLIAMFAGLVRQPMIPLAEGLAWTFTFIVMAYYGGNAAEAFANRNR